MDHLDVARTIIDQIGHNTLRAMGARSEYVATYDKLGGVIIRFGRIRRIKIALNWKDLYDVELWKVDETDVEKLAEESDVYVETLTEVIRSMLRASGYAHA